MSRGIVAILENEERHFKAIYWNDAKPDAIANALS